MIKYIRNIHKSSELLKREKIKQRDPLPIEKDTLHNISAACCDPCFIVIAPSTWQSNIMKANKKDDAGLQSPQREGWV